MEEMMDKMIDPKDFEIIKPLGSGAFGEVYKVKEKGSGNYFAAKVVTKSYENQSSPEFEAILNEIKIDHFECQKCNFLNVIKINDFESY